MDKLTRNDINIVRRKVREECINHRLAVYIENELSRLGITLNVDLEYSKNYNNPKEIVDSSNVRRNIRPDIIVHRRDNNENLIVFENKIIRTTIKDIETIKGLFKNPYNYSFGVLITYLQKKTFYKVGIYNSTTLLENYHHPK